MPTTDSKHPCPQCGSTTVLPIMYGLPAEESFEEAKRGEIALGGCCISEDSPRWHCSDCEHRWGRINDEYTACWDTAYPFQERYHGWRELLGMAGKSRVKS